MGAKRILGRAVVQQPWQDESWLDMKSPPDFLPQVPSLSTLSTVAARTIAIEITRHNSVGTRIVSTVALYCKQFATR